MALTNQYANLTSDIQNAGAALLVERNLLEQIIARWNLTDAFNQMQDSDIQAIPGFAHLNKSKISNAIVAFNAVLTALGDDVSGQSVNLINLKG